MRNAARSGLTDRGFMAAVAAILCGMSLLSLWKLGSQSIGMDFYSAWAMAQGIGRAEVVDPYARESQDGLRDEMGRRIELAGHPHRLETAFRAANPLRLTATPFLYATFAPWANGRYASDLHRFQVFSLLCLVASSLALGRLLGYSWPAALLWLSLLALYYQPLKAELRVANVNHLQLAWLTGYLSILWWSHRIAALEPGKSSLLRGIAGAVLGTGAAFKPTIAFAIVVVLVLEGIRGSLRSQAIGVVIGGCGAGLVGMAAFRNPYIWSHWVASWSELPQTATPVGYGNFALSRRLHDLIGFEAFGLLIAASLVWVVANLWRRRNHPSIDTWTEDVRAVGLGVLVFLISAPLVWQHYLVLLLPLFQLLLCPAAAKSKSTALVWLCFLLIATDPVAITFGIANPVEQSIFVQGGLVLLIATTPFLDIDAKRLRLLHTRRARNRTD